MLRRIFKKENKKKIFIGILIISLSMFAVFGGYVFYGLHKLDELSKMSFDDMLFFTTKDNEDAIISVGIVKDGKITNTVYGKNGAEISSPDHIYEIGSITKTFTASLLCKAISEDKINLGNSIDKYLNLPDKDYYPTIRRLVTHTSGYRGYYFEKPMITNFFFQDNDFYGISDEMFFSRLGKVNVENLNYKFKYSNFGIATLGLVLEELYDDNFTDLMNKYVKEDLGLEDTFVSNESSFNGWKWSDSDAYIPAGGLLSTISDMTRYLQIQMDGSLNYLDVAHDALEQVNATNSTYDKMGIRIDSVGIGWMIDTEKNIVWHNGATSNYNSYIGFDKDTGVGLVILSNLPPKYRIPATVMGIELLSTLQK